TSCLRAPPSVRIDAQTEPLSFSVAPERLLPLTGCESEVRLADRCSCRCSKAMGKFGDKVTEVADWASSAALADNTVASARKVTRLTIRIQPSGSKDLNALAKLALNEGARFSAPSEIPHY